MSSFAMENPQGFGLLQRGRQFSRFEDLDDRLLHDIEKKLTE